MTIHIERHSPIFWIPSFVLNSYFFENTTKAINILKEHLKDKETNTYNLNSLFLPENKTLLYLILSFDKYNGFINLLNNSTVKNTKMEKFPLDYLHSKGILFEKDIIPLRTYYELYTGTGNRKHNLLFQLYNLFQEIDSPCNNYYYLPEGIKEFNIDVLNYEIGEKIKAKAENKIVIFPKTLKIIGIYNNYLHEIYNVYKDKNNKWQKTLKEDIIIDTGLPLNYAKELILNDGLECINAYGAYFNGTEIEIPSSVKYIDEKAFNYRKLKTIIFKDYKHSNILYNEKEMVKIFVNIKDSLIIELPTNNIPIKYRIDKKSTYLSIQYLFENGYAGSTFDLDFDDVNDIYNWFIKQIKFDEQLREHSLLQKTKKLVKLRGKI